MGVYDAAVTNLDPKNPTQTWLGNGNNDWLSLNSDYVDPYPGQAITGQVGAIGELTNGKCLLDVTLGVAQAHRSPAPHRRTVPIR